MQIDHNRSGFRCNNFNIVPPPLKGIITDVLRYGENPRNLFRFTLCMEEFFDSIPDDQWKISFLVLLNNPKSV